MASADKELERQLMEAGVKLAETTSSVDELLPLLDKIESCLSRVEQSPSKSMQSALYPSLKALVADQLFRHSDVDVKVAVAACISEITRITAPDAPYDDEQMKEVFQLIVSSFENLSDKSSRSFAKRTSILETVAKVRSCVVMLDLECDALIIEMFQHFLKAIRDYHTENVFTCMETIMALVLEESEDISQELLSPILACVKKDNGEVLPIARKLGERVLESSAAKLKPYLLQAVKFSGISLDDYSKVLSSICQEVSGAVEQNDVHVSNEQMVDQQNATQAASTEQVDPANDKSPKSVESNDITQTEEGDSLADTDTLKKQESDNLTDPSKSVNTSSNAERDSLDTDKVVNEEQNSERATKKQGKKTTSSMNSGEPSDKCRGDGENEAEKPLDHKASSKDVPSSLREDPSVGGAVSSENGKETGTQISSPKVTGGESTDVSPSPAGNLPSEGRTQKAGRKKKKGSLVKEATPLADDVSRKVSEGTSDSEAKPPKQSRKKVLVGTASEDRTLTTNTLKKESGTTSDSEAKLLKLSAKKVDISNNNGDGSSSKQPDEKKRREKAGSGKDNAKLSTKDEKETGLSPKTAGKSNEDEHQVEETPKTTAKRKRSLGKEKASNTGDFGEILVGSKVKVWWPKDRQFYDGVIDSFDPVKKRHRVLYIDGDEEILNLKKERWELIGDDSESYEEQTTDVGSPDASEMPSNKRSKISSDLSTKQGKLGISPKRGGGASSSRSKFSAQKSGRKSKDESKVDGKSKDGSRTVTKSENDVASKSASKSKNDDIDTAKSSKSKESNAATPKTPLKSKQDTPKTSKSKQETPKTSSNSKGKTPKTVGKSSANGSGKSKSTSSKAKESQNAKDTTETKVPESSPSKTPQGSELKTGKKRRRG